VIRSQIASADFELDSAFTADLIAVVDDCHLLANHRMNQGKMKSAKGVLEASQTLLDVCIEVTLKSSYALSEDIVLARIRSASEIAQYYSKVGDKNNAIMWFLRATESGLEPDHPYLCSVHLNCCVIYSEAGLHKKALKHATTALRIVSLCLENDDMESIDPANVVLANLYLGYEWDALEKFEKAAQFYVASIESLISFNILEGEIAENAFLSYNSAYEAYQRPTMQPYYPITLQSARFHRSKWLKVQKHERRPQRLICPPVEVMEVKNEQEQASREVSRSLEATDQESSSIPPQSRRLSQSGLSSDAIRSDCNKLKEKVQNEEELSQTSTQPSTLLRRNTAPLLARPLAEDGILTFIPTLYDEQYYQDLTLHDMKSIVQVSSKVLKTPTEVMLEQLLRDLILKVEFYDKQAAAPENSSTFSMNAFFAVASLKMRCKLWKQRADRSAQKRGQVWSVGSNSHGQGGSLKRVEEIIAAPRIVSYFAAPRAICLKQIACGSLHAGAVSDQGRVFLWGDNAWGQCGQEEVEIARVPSHVPQLKDITMIALGGDFSLAVSESGSVFSFGRNHHGQLGRTADPAGRHFRPMAIGEKMFMNFKIIFVAAGEAHAACTDKAGNGFTWGWNTFCQLGIGDTKDRDHPVHLVQTARAAISVACGAEHTIFVNNAGEFLSCGNDRDGALGTGVARGAGQSAFQFVPRHCFLPGQQLARKVCCGFYHTLILSEKGEVYACGLGRNMQLGMGLDTNSLKTPTIIPALRGSRIVDIAAGTEHSLALSDRGRVFAWGTGLGGALGTGVFLDYPVPRVVRTLKGKSIRAIACGDEFSLLLTGKPINVADLSKKTKLQSTHDNTPLKKDHVRVVVVDMFSSLKDWLEKTKNTDQAMNEQKTAIAFEAYLRRVGCAEFFDFHRALDHYQEMDSSERFFEARDIVEEFIKKDTVVGARLPLTDQVREEIIQTVEAGSATNTLFDKAREITMQSLRDMFPDFVYSPEGQEVHGLARRAKNAGILQ
jgi:alpha-tubulin suppressor-like RCC1 family protein/tetratricopeptide (TPR) repeat protein